MLRTWRSSGTSTSGSLVVEPIDHRFEGTRFESQLGTFFFVFSKNNLSFCAGRLATTNSKLTLHPNCSKKETISSPVRRSFGSRWVLNSDDVINEIARINAKTTNKSRFARLRGVLLCSSFCLVWLSYGNHILVTVLLDVGDCDEYSTQLKILQYVIKL